MDSTTNLIDRAYGYRPEINYLVAGASGCGKTTFLERITIGKIGGDDFRVPNKPFVLTNSAQENSPLLNFHENECVDLEQKKVRPEVLVLCYDIGNPASLEELDPIVSLPGLYIYKYFPMARIYGADIAVVVIGLKRDLRHEKQEGEFIDPLIGYKTAQALEGAMYLECSATTEELIPAVVEDLVKKGLDVKTGKAYQASGMGNCIVC
ncbi:hypothetical protein TWF703_000447 [Orbilia oligospora]|uniref:Rho GTPase n=1 Tax=Orbilia oligospora TaxID=2813651 RepID=A0A7C8JKB9_ORBOL|nr:hypothetical protein TWF703_000447 [Orbilia oligospora]